MDIEITGITGPKNWYTRGIKSAYSAGHIQFLSEHSVVTHAASDPFSHILATDPDVLLLKGTNVRGLSNAAAMLVAERINLPNFDYLELGPGAGVATARVREILPSATIHTVSLTPINPYLSFNQPILDGALSEFGGHRVDYLQIYHEVERPFIDKQYLGTLPLDIGLNPDGYDFIYDSYGPLSEYIKTLFENESDDLITEAFNSALSILKRNGMIFMNVPKFYSDKFKLIETRIRGKCRFLPESCGDSFEPHSIVIEN